GGAGRRGEIRVALECERRVGSEIDDFHGGHDCAVDGDSPISADRELAGGELNGPVLALEQIAFGIDELALRIEAEVSVSRVPLGACFGLDGKESAAVDCEVRVVARGIERAGGKISARAA